MLQESRTLLACICLVILLLSIFSMPAGSTFKLNPVLASVETVKVSSPILKNAGGQEMSITAGKQTLLATTFSNDEDVARNVVSILEVRNSDGFTVFLSLTNSTIEPHESKELDVSWTPEETGTYETRTFAISQLIRPEVLSGIAVSRHTVFDGGSMPDLLSCNIPLSEAALPFPLETKENGGQRLNSRQDVVNYLADRNIVYASDILSRMRNADDALRFADEVGLEDESLISIAFRVELRCALGTNITDDAIDLLDSAGIKSLYLLKKMDHDDQLQIGALEYQLRLISVAKGVHYSPIENVFIPSPNGDEVRRWLSTADSARPIFVLPKNALDDTVLFSDNSTLVWPEAEQRIPPRQILLPSEEPNCITMSIKEWSAAGFSDLSGTIEQTVPVRIENEGILGIEADLPEGLDAATVMVQSTWPVNDVNPKAIMNRQATGKLYVWIETPSRAWDYALSLPDVYPLALQEYGDRMSQEEIGAMKGTVCIDFRELDDGPLPSIVSEHAFEGPDDISFFKAGPSWSNQIVKLHLTALSGRTNFVIKAPERLPPLDENRAGAIFTGVMPKDPSNPVADFDYSNDVTGVSIDPRFREWKIALGHFHDFCLSTPCLNDQNNMISFYSSPLVPESRASFMWEREDIFTTYYVGEIEKSLFSNSGEGALFGQGEINSSYSTTLKPTSGGDNRIFTMNYPQFVFREAEKEENGQPVFFPHVPTLVIEKSSLDTYDGYQFMATAFEDDDAWTHWLNPFTWYSIITGFIQFIGGMISCAATAGAGCLAAFCGASGLINTIGEYVDSRDSADPREGREDESFGTAISDIGKGDNYGLESSRRNTFPVEGVAKGDTDWYNAFGQVGALCGIGGAFTNLDPKTTFQTLKDVGGKAYAAYSAAKMLLPQDKPPWHKVDYHVGLVETYPNIDELKVRFSDAFVYQDRDGSWKGSGDIYMFTTVGSAGDGGDLVTRSPDTIGSVGLPMPEGLQLESLPLSEVDFTRYPQYGTGDVDENSPFDLNPDPVIFDRTYPANANVTGVYVEILLFDSDNFEDDEIGVVSEFHKYSELAEAVEKCDLGSDPRYQRDGNGFCNWKVTSTSVVNMYYNPDQQTYHDYGVGASISYIISIKDR